MRVLAYCANAYAMTTRRAAGTDPLRCPPVTAQTLDLGMLEGNDLVYLALHALPDTPALLGTETGPPVALYAHQLEGVNLGAAAVFVESCYLGDPVHPMRAALLKAGASVVVAGPGRNYIRRDRVIGADLLGLWFRRGLGRGLSVDKALRLAKWRVWVSAMVSPAARDALEFRTFT